MAPFPEDQFLPLFKKYGETSMDRNTIYLGRGMPNEQAAVWSKRVQSEPSWQTVFAFRIKGHAIGGNGLAFWYTREAHRTGIVYGGPDKFDGLGLFFDTFDEETKSETVPMVVGMVGDGKTAFRDASVTNSTDSKVIGSCFKPVRNTEFPVYVRITYFQRHLKVEIDNSKEGRNYNVCFNAYNVELPMGNYFGLSASSNMYPDKYELYALRTGIFSDVPRHADKMAIDKMNEDEIFKEQSSVVQMVEGLKLLTIRQKQMQDDMAMILGPPAKDQLPINNRMETLERDIRHLDNHLDRTEETLHAMMVLLKKMIKDTEMAKSAASTIGVESSKDKNIVDNIIENYQGYLALMLIQAAVTVVVMIFYKSSNRRTPQRKAL